MTNPIDLLRAVLEHEKHGLVYFARNGSALALLQQIRSAVEPKARIREFNMLAHEGQPIEATGIMEGPAIKQFAIACVDWFKKEGGQSFVTCDLTHPDGDAYQITMQKAGGKTPAQRIRELEAELAAHKSSACNSAAVVPCHPTDHIFAAGEARCRICGTHKSSATI